MDFSAYYTAVPSIVVICWLVGTGAKNNPMIKDNYIPVIVGVTGAVLGLVGLYFIPEFPAYNFLDAIALGIVSGLASTGIHQAVKQIKKGV